VTKYTGASAEAHWDASVERYILALDAGDLDTVALILDEAQTDPELDRLLVEVDEALHAEANLPTRQENTQKVRQLLRQHLSSAFAETAIGPPTVGDVAAKLQSEHASNQQLLLAGDITANDQLLGNHILLTGRPNPRLARQIAEATGVQASDHYWERFRRAAVVLMMARDSGAIQLAAARKRIPRKPGRPNPAPDES
jgi:hypothetical protein